ncbi:MAG: hydrogenase maturation nickel metallochaperone HypA [Actinomycetia bacterium]|nr:hydrogenase maturation nickel metallochaperone HypA [Actinomycetes bacterium]MCL2730351.1 hydrogenase maturation nickel metallochaperone HypA [Actinomycetes bacterium]
MHEMSIALAVVGQVEDAARSHGHTAVESVALRVGELAGVVPDALRFCFELACENTLLAGATLLTQQVPGRASCAPCGSDWDTGLPPQLCCPCCGGAAGGLLSGRELEIAEVRWADAGAATACQEV